ncbi:putative ribonuclease H-like domain-containing protein [Tanacetum coccineum]
MKIPIIKKGEYDIWSMRMRQYICHTDHNLWDIIVNSDLQEEAAPAGEPFGPPAPKTTKQLATKQNQERDAIKSRFGGNDESKKMHRNVLKHQFENFTTAPNESLDKAYDMFQKLISQLKVYAAIVSKEDINQKFLRSLPPSWSQIALIMRNKPDLDQNDIDDLYNNLRVYKDEIKRSLSSTSNSQNLAFLSFKNTSSTNEIDQDDIEELDIRWQVAMLTVRVQRFIQKTGRNLDFNGKQPVTFDKSKVKCYNCHRKGHFAKECKSRRNQGKRSYGDNGRRNATTNEPSSQALNYDTERERHSRARLEIQGYELALESLESRIIGHEKNELGWGEKYEFQNYELKCREVKIDNLKMELVKVVKERDELKVKIEKWEESSKGLNKLLNSQMSAKNKNGLGYDTQLDEMSNKSETDSEISMSVFEVRSSDEEITPANDRFSKADGYHVVPPPIIGNFLTPRVDISFAGLDEYAIRKKIIESKTTEPKDDTSKSKTSETVDDEDDVSQVNTVSPVKTNETQTVKTQAKKNPEHKLKTVVNTSQRVVKPVWDNAKRVNHQKFSNKLKYPQTRRTFIPKGVLTKTCLINLVRPNGKRAVHTVSTARPISTDRPISTARPVSTARPFAPKKAQTGSAIRPIYPRMDNVRPRALYSPIKRSYYKRPAFRPKDLKQDVKTSGVKNMTTAKTSAVVNTGKGKMDNALKKSRWGNPKIILQDHTVVDSGCSSHMTGNKAYLSDYEDYNGGFMAFGSDPKGGKITGKGKIKTANLDFDDVYFVDELNFKLLVESQVVLRAPRQNDAYSLDLKNIIPSGGITCLYANATTAESKMWHGRLGHVNFKNINKLVKGHLVRGLPSKVFVNDHTCVACKKGKQHKASYKAKLERTIRNPLELLHMDLFGHVSVESINKKKYCLVMTDDFSKFSWVFFLATKDETNEILYKFITGLENYLNHKVKIIRCDHRTEFSVARTLQQNGVAERKNRTLIEAARTMLADLLLPIPFWAEAVNTACYVLNRVLVTKPQNKTPYELLIGKPPSISFMRPFGCPLTILNTLDPLGKFDGKSDEGYLLGYSTTSKAFRVYNKRTKRVEENMHIDFLEDQPNVTGSGPDWMFDLDFRTNTMNYIPVSVENLVNVDADNDVQDSEDVAEKEEQHILTEADQALKDDFERMIAQEIAAEEEAIKAALIQDFDDIQARIEANRLLAARLQEEERETFTVEERAKFLYDTIAAQRRFLARQKCFKEMNKESKDPKKKRLKKRVVNETPREEDTAKVPAEQEVTEQGIKKRKSGHVKMIARKRPRPHPHDEHKKCLRIVTFDSTIDSEIMETKSFVSKLHKVSSLDGDYLVVYRVNGFYFRAFISMRWRLEIMMESSTEENDQGDFWNNQQDWEISERRYPLSKELLQRMLDLGLEVEEESTAALQLVRFIKQQLNES